MAMLDLTRSGSDRALTHIDLEIVRSRPGTYRCSAAGIIIYRIIIAINDLFLTGTVLAMYWFASPMWCHFALSAMIR
jgi:hypothetical protein